MFKFKNYKKLYEIEKKNNGLIMERNRDLHERYVNIQLDKKVLVKNVEKLKEENARLKIELEDTKGFLEQEKACSTALRTKLASQKSPKPRQATRKVVKKDGK